VECDPSGAAGLIKENNVKFSQPFGHEGQATLVISVGVIIYLGNVIGGNPWWASALAGLSGSAIVFLLCKWPSARKYMLSADAPVWFTKEQMDEHYRTFGTRGDASGMYVASGVQALEVIAPAAADLFQSRKIGMQVLIPDEVADAYIGKHGDDGRKVVDMLRGNVTL
jgi:hypothetical protein